MNEVIILKIYEKGVNNPFFLYTFLYFVIIYCNRYLYNIKLKKKDMKKLLEFIDNWGIRLSFGLVLIIFLKTCTTNTKIEKVQKELDKKTVTIDSTLIQIDNKIDSKIITEDKMIKLIKEVPNWKTLELEELSDKNRIPINKLKNDNEK